MASTTKPNFKLYTIQFSNTPINPSPSSNPKQPNKLKIDSIKQKHKNGLFLVKVHGISPLDNPENRRKWRRKAKIGSEAMEGQDLMWALCGVGYWMQGFRCFPWLALNFHMAHGLQLSPSVLQLVQNAGNLPLVAKPIFGLLSDAVYIGGAHRVPYISIGVFLQALSWGTLTVIPSVKSTFFTMMACILLSNLGASITEVVTDALVAEFSRTQKAGALQSYAFIALASGALLANLSGGFFLQKTQNPKIMFLIFSFLLTIQLAISLKTKETSLPSPTRIPGSISKNLNKQLSEVVTAINEPRIFYPLLWIVGSTALVPSLSGSLFCFHTQCLNLDASVIGLSKVVGQLMVLSATVFYNKHLKKIPMRRFIFLVHTTYAMSFLLDLALVKQFNLNLGISNEVYVLLFSSLAEALGQFKVLPFTVLFSRLCPKGCEGSLFACFASALCLSSIFSGVLGVGLASFIGVSSGDYSTLQIGILVQIFAALVPLGWIGSVPNERICES